MKLSLLVVLCFVAAREATAAPAYQWGDENVACTRLKPVKRKFVMNEIEDREYYRIVPNSETFHPGGKLYIRIMGKKPNDTYNNAGFILTVTEASMPKKVVGNWGEANPRRFNRMNCFGIENAAIAELGGGLHSVPVEEDVLVWMAPDSCSKSGFYDLRGTVIKNVSEIITGLSVRLNCVQEKMTAKPADSCAANYTMGNMSATSFETGFGGWWNDPAAPLRWTRNSGPTPSMFTGPTSALTGDYYVYVEASHPAREGDVAILNSPPGLNGCFCVRLNCHMWTGKGTYFTSKVNGQVMWSHTASANAWLKGWQSVNDANYPVVQFVMHRGSDFRGDLALDDIEIQPGLCPEDIGGGGFPIWENPYYKRAK